MLKNNAIVLVLLLVILSPVAVSFSSILTSFSDLVELTADYSEEESNEDKDGEEEVETELLEYLLCTDHFLSPNTVLGLKYLENDNKLIGCVIDVVVPPPQNLG